MRMKKQLELELALEPVWELVPSLIDLPKSLGRKSVNASEVSRGASKAGGCLHNAAARPLTLTLRHYALRSATTFESKVKFLVL